MTPQMIRLVAGFLAAFVLLSAAPSLPAAGAWLADPALGDVVLAMLPYTGAALLAAVGAIALLRRRRRRAATPAGGGRSPAPARRRAQPQPAASAFAEEIRQAARRGARAPELARRFRTSQDAIRVVLGREGAPSAAPAGSSFRARQAALAPRPAARALPPARNRYHAHA